MISAVGIQMALTQRDALAFFLYCVALAAAGCAWLILVALASTDLPR